MFGHLSDQGNFGISEIENYKENECKEESVTDISMSVHFIFSSQSYYLCLTNVREVIKNYNHS